MSALRVCLALRSIPRAARRRLAGLTAPPPHAAPPPSPEPRAPSPEPRAPSAAATRAPRRTVMLDLGAAPSGMEARAAAWVES